MKAYIAAILARQVAGEYVFLKLEKASFNKAVIEQFYKELPIQEALTVEGIKCLAERSILEIEIE